MATVGQVLTYRGELAAVFYSASCGGRSERASDVWPGADYPYLVSRRDDVCEDDPEWTVDFSLDQVRRALERVGFEGERLRDVAVDGHTSSGRVARLRLSGMRPNVIAAINSDWRLEPRSFAAPHSTSRSMATNCDSPAAAMDTASACVPLAPRGGRYAARRRARFWRSTTLDSM
jgi:SpoIID/LytB domain protein